MNSKPKRIILLPVILFEVYFIADYIRYFATNGQPNVPYWILICLVKIVIGFIVYRLYISKRKNVSMWGPLILIIDMILTFIAYYAHLDQLSNLLIGGTFILLAANTVFLHRYFKVPEIIDAYFEGLTNVEKRPFGNAAFWYRSVITLEFAIVFLAAIGREDSIMAWGAWLWWVVFYASIEGIIKKRKPVSDSSSVNNNG